MNHNEMKKNIKLSIYQSVILIVAAGIISFIPSLLICYFADYSVSGNLFPDENQKAK